MLPDCDLDYICINLLKILLSAVKVQDVDQVFKLHLYVPASNTANYLCLKTQPCLPSFSLSGLQYGWN